MAPDPAGGDDSPPAHVHGPGHPLGHSTVARLLLRVTQWLALAGGILLVGAMGLTVVSVTGRYAFGAPVPGDYEIVEIICAVSVFLFFPFTHATDGNITAEFFTSGLSLRHRRMLDAIHDVIFAIVAAALAWRLSHSLVEKFYNGDMSILIHIPLWWAYSFAVLSMALLAVICVWRIVAAIEMLRR